MSDALAAQLLKLGLVSPEAAQRATDPRPPPRNENRGGGRRDEARGAQPGNERAPRDAQRRDAQGRDDSRRSGGRPDATEDTGPVDREAALTVLASATRLGGASGGRRFYYESRDGRVPCIDLSDEAHRALSEGAMAVVETEAGEPRLLPAEAASRLAKTWPALVRAWRR